MDQVTKKKRVLSPEHIRKMQEGRKKKSKDIELGMMNPESTMKAPEVLSPKKDFKIFGKTDRDSKGKIRSQYPSWYQIRQKEELERTIEESEAMLEKDAIPQVAKPRFREVLRQRKAKLEMINEETPRPKGSELDSISKMRNDIGNRIKDAHFKDSDRQKGLADAHEEARRMVEPVMEIKSRDEADFARACGIEIKNGKVSRNDMERMYQIQSRMIGEPGNISQLRR